MRETQRDDATRQERTDVLSSAQHEEWRTFALILCRGLLFIVQGLNKQYRLGLRLKE
jgi:hypothetical protein